MRTLHICPHLWLVQLHPVPNGQETFKFQGQLTKELPQVGQILSRLPLEIALAVESRGSCSEWAFSRIGIPPSFYIQLLGYPIPGTPQLVENVQ